jgi:hypothetical protein
MPEDEHPPLLKNRGAAKPFREYSLDTSVAAPDHELIYLTVICPQTSIESSQAFVEFGGVGRIVEDKTV